MVTPHDIYFHATFRHPRQAEAWLRTLLPRRLVARLDWSTLQNLGERLHARGLGIGVADLVFLVRFLGSRRRLLLPIEHRSSAGPGLREALLRYAVHLLHGITLDEEGDDAPTAVFAVALCHGAARPELRPRVALEFPAEERELLLPWQPRLRFATENLERWSEGEILARPLLPRGQLTWLGVRFLPKFDAAETLAALHRWGGLLRAVDRADRAAGGGEAISTFGSYLLHVNDTPAEDVHMTLEKNLQRREGTFMSTAEKLKREGEATSLVRTLLRQLTRRFGPLPPTVEPRLLAATIDELDQMADRVLDAPTLEAVLGQG